MSEKNPSLSSNAYQSFLSDLKKRIRTAQLKAARSVNRELVLLYWQIGADILQRQEAEGWGTKVIGTLSKDLRQAFPEMKGFSPRNLSTYGLSRNHGRIRKLCKRCLHKFRGITT